MHFWTLKNILTHLNFHIVPYKKAPFSLYQSSGIFQIAINFILSDLSMAFETRRQLTWKQRDTKYWRTNAINSKLSRQIWTPPLSNPPPNVIWSRWPRHVLLMIGHLQVLNVITINIMIVIATIAMIGQLQDLTIIMAVIANHHLLSISDQPMVKEEQT